MQGRAIPVTRSGLQDRIASVSRDLTDAGGEITQLKSTIAKLKKELEQLGGKK
jgi:peptidoglycan hydrolase CwlO-like protein